MPKGYVIGQMDITDPDMYPSYAKDTPASIAEFGGRFIVRGGTAQSIEGDAPRSRTVVIEFPSVARAHEWYDSPNYQKIVGIRHAAATGSLYIVEGAD